MNIFSDFLVCLDFKPFFVTFGRLGEKIRLKYYRLRPVQ